MANETEKVTKPEKKKNELVELRLPLTHNPEIDAYPVFASFNFKNYLIKRGETVKVPKALYDRFQEIERAKDEAYVYSQKMSLDAAEKAFKQQMGL